MLSIVEVPIVFCYLNILVPLNFMLEVCYLNVLVLMIFVIEACCTTQFDNQTQSSSLVCICLCSLLSNFVDYHFNCSTTIPLFSHCLHQVEEKSPLCFFQVHMSCICFVHKLFVYVFFKFVNCYLTLFVD
jgi:riboflavin transporter FmnP